MIALPQLFNAATYFVDRNVLEGRAHNIAIECGSERVTYQQLFERTNRAGNALRNLGVRSEERVLLLLLDSPEFLYSFFGAIKIGAVAVPVNTKAKPHDCEYILNDSRARVPIVSEALLQQLQAIPRQNLGYLREIIVVGNANPAHQHPRLRDLMDAASPDLTAEPTSKDDAAFWLYSSGSTGVPKGCVHLHHDMVVSSHHYAHAILKITERDRCFSDFEDGVSVVVRADDHVVMKVHAALGNACGTRGVKPECGVIFGCWLGGEVRRGSIH